MQQKQSAIIYIYIYITLAVLSTTIWDYNYIKNKEVVMSKAFPFPIFHLIQYAVPAITGRRIESHMGLFSKVTKPICSFPKPGSNVMQDSPLTGVANASLLEFTLKW
mmetsp:Transcript_37003/g.47181  ORF Transcript_37003/g.47181 Transcript_37003/m.47181 type:complete len:107 (-) Transcript_37003:846-1166(-)